MVGVRFKVTDWRAWAPGLETLDAWQDWAGMPRAASDGAWSSMRLAPLLQRRLGSLGQKAVSAALGCAPSSDVRYVLASRHGDLARTVGLLQSLAVAEALSPTDFTMSVHHALVGLLSIHTGNREGHTAVAAAADTFGFGFLEAAAYVAAESKPALLLFFDAPLPAEYSQFETGDDAIPLVVAAQLEPASGDELDYGLSAAPNGHAEAATEIPAKRAPLDFLRFLISGAPSVVSPGQRMDWRWHRA